MIDRDTVSNKETGRKARKTTSANSVCTWRIKREMDLHGLAAAVSLAGIPAHRLLDHIQWQDTQEGASETPVRNFG